MAGPLIVTAELGPQDFAWLNDLRRRHYPVERNQLDAHLTMFHAVPPSAEGELRRILASAAQLPEPQARMSSVMNLGGGVALRVASDELAAIREGIAERLHGLLTAQDAAGWSAHVTIQNKVSPRDARALMQAIGEQFAQRPIRISGLGLHRYLGGPWETLQLYAFRG
jgi:2'-5' RNA ligase superfamily